MKLPKNYNPKESEPKWLEFWEKEKVYAFDPKSKEEDKEQKEEDKKSTKGN